jgi:phage shock protein E
MFQQLKNLFGGKAEDFAALVKAGAQVIDVRSREEFSGGHLKGSVNIPLQELPRQLTKIKKEKPVIVCCASGMRSGSAKDLLKLKGYTVYNGGGWSSLERKLKET